MSTMTLEQVRDWLRKPSKVLRDMYRGRSRKSLADEACECADAIDAHLREREAKESGE